jgi:hypothetical protein
MPRNKRERFPLTSYARTLNRLSMEFLDWRDVYSDRAEACQGDWLRAQLLRRSRVADELVHQVDKLDALLWDLAQTPLAPSTLRHNPYDPSDRPSGPSR